VAEFASPRIPLTLLKMSVCSSTSSNLIIEFGTDIMFEEADLGGIPVRTRYVCEFSNRKTGGYDCKASFRAKKFHHNGSATVEKSDAEHDDNPQADDQRVYGVYTKKFNQKI